ncbi:MAG TPA: hypothetical protein VLE89_08090 [Chlamydiales bacterium]|nr:hypothetical protein [Chlamydiales bacterium]
MKKFIVFFLVVPFFLWLPYGFKRWAHPFRLNKCAIEWPNNPEWEIPGDPPPWIVDLFQKPFTYFSRGRQTYVFLSSDGNYVLKLFRFDSYQKGKGSKIFKNIQKWMGYHPKENVRSFEERVPMTFHSCHLSHVLAPHLTGVVWTHLNPKNGKFPLFIVKNRLGQKFKVDPSQYRFIIQKKGISLKEALLKLDRKGLIDSYKLLLEELKSLGLSSQDPKLGDNFGVLDGKVIAMDVGDFVQTADFPDSEIPNYINRLNQWLEKND